jgi:deoxyribonuclease V
LKIDKLFQFTNQGHAISFQRENASRVICVDEPDFNPRLICGLDVSYDDDTAYAAAVVWDIRRRTTVEKIAVKDRVLVRYYPGLLGFREGPVLARVSEKLETNPDVFFVDGQGVAHPRRFGLACQFGLAIDRPTVGVAKSLLYGRAEDEIIVDPGGHRIATVIVSARGKKFYVSVGHRISLDTASRLVSDSIIDGQPVPLRQAHLESELSKRSKLL